jgi:hypothetical protein
VILSLGLNVYHACANEILSSVYKQDEKKSVHEIYKAAQEVCLQVQQGMDTVASLGERFKK